MVAKLTSIFGYLRMIKRALLTQVRRGKAALKWRILTGEKRIAQHPSLILLRDRLGIFRCNSDLAANGRCFGSRNLALPHLKKSRLSSQLNSETF
jgi:hypothetical protein